MVALRFQRLGRKNAPYYRLAALDSRTRRDGPVIENLGWYDPTASDQSKQLELNLERVKYWLSVGAQPSDTVRDILAKKSLIDTKSWEAERTRRRELIAARKAAEAAAGEKKEEATP